MLPFLLHPFVFSHFSSPIKQQSITLEKKAGKEDTCINKELQTLVQDKISNPVQLEPENFLSVISHSSTTKSKLVHIYMPCYLATAYYSRQ